MKKIYILRHAKSSWKDEGLPDHDRPLNKRGKRDAPRMGRLLAEEGLVPDLIVSSTAKRAHKTTTEVADACGYKGEIALNSWAAEDLQVDVGDTIRVSFFQPETTHGRAVEQQESFKVVHIVALTAPDKPYARRRPAIFVHKRR